MPIYSPKVPDFQIQPDEQGIFRFYNDVFAVFLRKNPGSE